MGTCCSKDGNGVYGRYMENDVDDKECDGDEDIAYGDGGAIVRLQGSSALTSMHTQRGRKGINQDAMTVWEEFTGEKGTFFCGVFDGHGPFGHFVARHVRDNLPSTLSKSIELSRLNSLDYREFDVAARDDSNHSQLVSMWERSFVESFKEMDEKLSVNSSIDSFCSGTTAVTLVRQGNHLIVANLGDSRAVLCTRGDRNQLLPLQLTVDQKPDIPSESQRIQNCKGRVFAADEEPDVYRLWMPDEDTPGLAMSRSFGDFCLKDYGLISIPEVSYRKLTSNDEFIVLASDGIWDVLTNIEVISIVASARKRSMAAKLLVSRAVRAWKYKYPGSKVDDCAVICLFLKTPPCLAESRAALINGNLDYSAELPVSYSSRFSKSEEESEPGNGKSMADSTEEWNALEGVSRVNSLLRIPRLARALSRQKPSKNVEGIKGH